MYSITAIRKGEPMPQSAKHSLLIPLRSVGFLIGKQGSTIKSLCQQSGAKIQVSTGDGPRGEREVTIVGTPQQMHIAKQLIHAKLNGDQQISIDQILSNQQYDPQAPSAAPSYSGGGSGNDYGNDYGNSLARGQSQAVAIPITLTADGMVLTLPQNKIGAIIGKGGCTVHQITEDSGASISVQVLILV
jgi:far upstream element-binding protein